MQATTAASWIALLSMPPQCSRRSRRTASASPASLSLSRASICRKNQRRDETAKAAIKQMPMAKTRRPVTATASVPMAPAMATVRKKPLNMARNSRATAGMSSFTSRKAGAASREIDHRKQQDDGGEQRDVIWHPPIPSFPRRATGGIHNNIRLDLSPTPLDFGRMRYRTACTRFVQDRMNASVNRVNLAVCQPLPVYPQLRTYRCTALTDAMCQERKSPSFDALVGADEERGRDRQPNGLGGACVQH